MKPSERKIWFPAKKYGWGWGPPNCWQGWLVLAVWFVALTAGIPLALRNHFLFIAYTLFLSAVLVFICWLKGEKPRWRWGKD
jgi:hypothetical protein